MGIIEPLPFSSLRCLRCGTALCLAVTIGPENMQTVRYRHLAAHQRNCSRGLSSFYEGTRALTQRGARDEWHCHLLHNNLYHIPAVNAAIASDRGTVNRSCVEGRRLMARGSVRSGRFPTMWELPLRTLNRANRVEVSAVWGRTAATNQPFASSCRVAVKLNWQGHRSEAWADWRIDCRTRL